LSESRSRCRQVARFRLVNTLSPIGRGGAESTLAGTKPGLLFRTGTTVTIRRSRPSGPGDPGPSRVAGRGRAGPGRVWPGGEGGPGRAGRAGQGRGRGRGGRAGGPGGDPARRWPGINRIRVGAGYGRGPIKTGTILDIALTSSKTLVAAVQPGPGL
jgi:hypothetical protein